MKLQPYFLACVLSIAFFTSNAQLKPAVLTGTFNSEEEKLAKEAVSLVIMSKLHEIFPNTTDESWTKQKNGYYVNFKQDNITHEVFLNKKGRLTGQIRHISEKDLPANVLRLAKEFDDCYTISFCKEVITDLGQAYLITINGKNNWKILRVVNNEIDIYQEHKKG